MKRLFVLALFSSLVSVTWGAQVMFYQTTGGVTTATTNRIEWTGGSDPLVGTNIDISAGRRDEPTPGLPIACPLCVLNFTTGAHILSGGSLDIFEGVGAGSGFTIESLAPAIDPFSGILVTGYFTDFVTVSSTGPSGTLRVAAGVVINSQPNAAWNTAVFAPGPIPGSTPWTGQLSLDFQDSGAAGVAFTSDSINTDLDAFKNEFVPEPSSYALFGAVASVLGMGLWRRRRNQV